MKLLAEEFDLDFLRTKYENISFHMFRSDDPFTFISCITCICNSAEDITLNWSAIQGFVTAHYQPEGGLASWNVYLAFITVDRVPLWEKYEIENNKFCSRKIILDEIAEIPSLDELSKKLEEKLLGTDLTIEQSIEEPEERLFSLEEYFRGAPLDSKPESREKRSLMISNIIERLSKHEN